MQFIAAGGETKLLEIIILASIASSDFGCLKKKFPDKKLVTDFHQFYLKEKTLYKKSRGISVKFHEFQRDF